MDQESIYKEVAPAPSSADLHRPSLHHAEAAAFILSEFELVGHRRQGAGSRRSRRRRAWARVHARRTEAGGGSGKVTPVPRRRQPRPFVFICLIHVCTKPAAALILSSSSHSPSTIGKGPGVGNCPGAEQRLRNESSDEEKAMAPLFIFGGVLSAAGGEAGAARSSPAPSRQRWRHCEDAGVRSDVKAASDAGGGLPLMPSYAEPKSRSSTRRLSMHCHRCTCVVIKKLASYSGMREDVRAPPRGAHKNKCIYVQMPYHYKRMKLSADGLPVGLLRPSTPRLLVALLGRASSPSSTWRRSRRAAGIRHLLSSRPSGLHQREGERQWRGASGSWSTFACSSSTTTSARPLAEQRPPHRRRLLWLGRRQSGGTAHH